MLKRFSAAIERRVLAARLSLCLSALSVLLVVLMTSPSGALAVEPAVPAVTGTNPPSTALSPAFSTNPLVFGEAEAGEGHTSAIPAATGGSPFFPAATKHPEYEIRLYLNDPGCGSPIAQVSAAEFEAGIEVTVPANAVSTFYARQYDTTDPTHPSDCSSGFSYWEGDVSNGSPGGSGTPGGGGAGSGSGGGEGAGRPEAPQLRTNPSGTANDNTPQVTGSAPGAATVKVFTQPGCAGPTATKGPASQFEAGGLKVQVPDNVIVGFSALSIGSNGAQSRCSATASYVEDSTAPHTRITMGPASKTRKRKVVFRFTDTTGDAPGTSFFCKVDKAKWRQCSSPLRLRKLRLKEHRVAVKAVDPAGNVERKPAKRRFKVIRHP